MRAEIHLRVFAVIQKILPSFAVISAFLIFFALPAGAQKTPLVVLLDPAHGGNDYGVVSDSFHEKDATLQMALLIQKEATKKQLFQVYLTRTADKSVSIAERVRLAETMKACCLLSLHVNAGFANKANGYELYFPGFVHAPNRKEGSNTIIKDMLRNKSLNESVLLFQHIQASLETVFPRKGRGLREASCPLLDRLHVPALVLEIGFATHPGDRKYLTVEKNQRAIAGAILNGIEDYSRTLR
jgi:N-acetylmuramoyl-L-alanine amidase